MSDWKKRFETEVRYGEDFDWDNIEKWIEELLDSKREELIEEIRQQKGYPKDQDGAYTNEFERGLNKAIAILKPARPQEPEHTEWCNSNLKDVFPEAAEMCDCQPKKCICKEFGKIGEIGGGWIDTRNCPIHDTPTQTKALEEDK